MDKTQLESRILDILSRVESKQPLEDATVELKAEWLEDVRKMARQIAAHANAARGAQILWVIGVDERGGNVPGAGNNELSNWLSEFRRYFDDGFAPSLACNLIVPYESRTVVGLLFDTDRPPYVVKNPEGGPISHEVPWREGNSTRSARRIDLLRMLQPLAGRPEIEIMSGKLHLMAPHGHGRRKEMHLSLQLYVTSPTNDFVVFPFHRAKVQLFNPSTNEISEFTDLQLSSSRRLNRKEWSIESRSFSVESSDAEAMVRIAGMLNLTARLPDANPGGGPPRKLQVKVSLRQHNADMPVNFDVPLELSGPSGASAVWYFTG